MSQAYDLRWGHMPEHDFRFCGSSPVVYHCNHFNLFWDQTIEDALGFEAAIALKTRSARDAAYALLTSLGEANGLATTAERTEFAQWLFAGMGHGTLTLDLGATPGASTAQGEWLHYGWSWKEKYGKRIRRRHPIDCVAAGFAAAATAYALGLPVDTLDARESACIVTGEPKCRFEMFQRDDAEAPGAMCTREAIEGLVPDTVSGRHEDRIVPFADQLRAFTLGIEPDERGLVPAFGVLVTLHMSNYYNLIAYRALEHIQTHTPQSTEVFKALLREAGHACIFYTFGGIMASPELEGLRGPVPNDKLSQMIECCAIARALGFGKWSLRLFDPGEVLILRSPGTYESVFWRATRELAHEPICYVFQGAALAMMQLTERIEWSNKPVFDQSAYNALFRQGVPWKVTETQCVGRGDKVCEVIVTRG